MSSAMVELLKVDDWDWTLYRLEYTCGENCAPKITDHVVSTPEHIEFDATEQDWPSSSMKFVRWTPIRDVKRPRSIGNLYGGRVDASGRVEARHLIKENVNDPEYLVSQYKDKDNEND